MSDIAYLDHAAASEHGQRYKARLLDRLAPAAGETVLDIGCGPGTDLAGFVDAVGPTGRVIGVDQDQAMVAEASDRFGQLSYVDIRVGDAHALPVEAASVDRVRIDRVLQHLAEPARALAEIRRVLRPGGRVALADPDWDSLAIDDPDLDTSRAYTRYVSEHVVRNAAMGRQLARLAHDAGLTVRVVSSDAITFVDHASAEPILRVAAVARRGIADGALEPTATEAWLDRLAHAPTFLASFTFYTVVADG
jgi:ubiquinone/menaquinone biosynthesis C-methylase UbiE